MLSARNRLRRATDFRAVSRQGARKGSRTVVAFALAHEPSMDRTAGPRFGLIVGKSVGNSVERHRQSRRLRHILRELADDIGDDYDIVLRALPAITTASHEQLTRDVVTCTRRAVGLAAMRRKAVSTAELDTQASTGNGGTPHGT